MSVLAAVFCSTVGKTVPETSGSFAMRSAGIDVACHEVVVAGRCSSSAFVHHSWPASEYRYSSHSFAAFGCGAVLLIPWT